eukprot:1993945-Rhodomonas_salina.2
MAVLWGTAGSTVVMGWGRNEQDQLGLNQRSEIRGSRPPFHCGARCETLRCGVMWPKAGELCFWPLRLLCGPRSRHSRFGMMWMRETDVGCSGAEIAGAGTKFIVERGDEVAVLLAEMHSIASTGLGVCAYAYLHGFVSNDVGVCAYAYLHSSPCTGVGVRA